MKGTIMALASITLTSGTNLEGRALARTGAVTLDSNSVTIPILVVTPPVTPPSSDGGSGGGGGVGNRNRVVTQTPTITTPTGTGGTPTAAGPGPSATTPTAPTPGFFAGITGAVVGALGEGGALFALIFIALIVLLAVLAAVLSGRQNRALAARQRAAARNN